MDTAFTTVAVIAVLFQSLVLFLAFFEPPLPYKVAERPAEIDSPEFLRVLGILADAQLHENAHVDVLANGEAFYEVELEAIAGARHNINLEAYIFQQGEIARRFIAALAERARSGVKVSIVLDAIGSFNTWRRTFRELIDAGGQVCWYQTVRWYNLPKLTHRTHRELLIVDGRVAFLGGAGVADHWYKGKHGNPRWRDTMFRVTGGAVASLQATFAENWLEASGEMLTAPEYFPPLASDSHSSALVVASSPSVARATRARILYQTLLASACRTVDITTPYFLPDRHARAELVKAIRERGVRVRIIVPGKHSDHLLTRRSSRRLYGELLKAGASIHEYRPAMIHAKTMVVDGLWSVVGSTNFDHRSFGLNDEVNLAVRDGGLASRIGDDFACDLAASHQVSYREWRRRSPLERVHEWFGWILERQQ